MEGIIQIMGAVQGVIFSKDLNEVRETMWLSVKKRKSSKCQSPEADICLTLLLFHEHVLDLKHKKRGGRVADSCIEEGQSGTTGPGSGKALGVTLCEESDQMVLRT